MAEISVTIRTTKPEEAVKLAELMQAFLGQTPVKVITAEEVKVESGPVVHKGQTKEQVKQEVKLDASLIRQKVGTALAKNKEVNHPKIKDKLVELKASSVSTLEEKHFEEFNQFLDQILGE